jgi:hypothetical protein
VGILNTYKLLSEKDYKFKYFKIFEKEKNIDTFREI